MASKCSFDKLEDNPNWVLTQVYTQHESGMERMICLQSHISKPYLTKFQSLVDLYFDNKTKEYIKDYIPYIIFFDRTNYESLWKPKLLIKYIEFMQRIIKKEKNLRIIIDELNKLGIPLYYHLWLPLLIDEKRPENTLDYEVLWKGLLKKPSDQWLYKCLDIVEDNRNEKQEKQISDIHDYAYDYLVGSIQNSIKPQLIRTTSPIQITKPLRKYNPNELSVINEDDDPEPSIAVYDENENDDQNKYIRKSNEKHKSLLHLYRGPITHQKQPYKHTPSLIIPTCITLIQGALLGGSLYLFMNKRIKVKVIPPNPF